MADKLSFSHVSVTRRQVLGSLITLVPALAIVGCHRSKYYRPAAELDLGTVKELLYAEVHVRSKAVLVYRDADGWRALSTRCTFHGCDLTYQPPVLLCPCCRSRFDLEGRVIEGSKAPFDLPWIEITYKDGHLYGNPGSIKPANYRFTTPAIENAIRKLRERIKEEGMGDEVRIPEFLQGKSDGEPGRMFLEDDPNLIHEMEMVK